MYALGVTVAELCGGSVNHLRGLQGKKPENPGAKHNELANRRGRGGAGAQELVSVRGKNIEIKLHQVHVRSKDKRSKERQQRNKAEPGSKTGSWLPRTPPRHNVS